jgi:hypothetical protein
MMAILILIFAQYVLHIDVIHEHPALLFGSLTMTMLMCVGNFTGARE